MGNCQAVDAAALVIQHPSGRVDRLYWPVTASEIMRSNPGHYVSLIIPLPVKAEQEQIADPKKVQFARVKLLRPTDNLALGHAYRLVTTQEVAKVMRSKKYAKARRQQDKVDMVSPQNRSSDSEASCPERNDEGTKRGQRRRPNSSNSVTCKTWRPSLESISEANS